MSRRLRAAALAALLAACAGVGGEPRGDRAPIDHVVVLFLENRSFDHLFGTYPGADGLANYKGRQADKSGATYATLPPPLGRDGKPDPRFAGDLPNAPFPLLRFVQPFDLTNNPVHRFYHMQRQYAAGADGVPMGKWVAEGTSGGITMGFYDRAASPVQWRLADEFVLLDRYFQSIHGGSFANHYFLITAAVAHVADDPEYRAVAGPDGSITYAFPTCFPNFDPPGCPVDDVLQLASTMNAPAVTRTSDDTTRGYVTTPPTCPASGQWDTTIKFWWADGSQDTAVTQTPCRLADASP